MSRIGKKAVAIPSGVQVTSGNNRLSVQGPKGKLEFPLYPKIAVKTEGGAAHVSASGSDRQTRAYHGLTRAALMGMVHGVTQGYEKKLEVVGVGWNAKIQGKELHLQVGYCLSAIHKIPDGITVTCPVPTSIVIQGIDKQKLGQFAAEVRASRPPEPYNGKGVKYDNEVIKRKAGKSFAAAGA